MRSCFSLAASVAWALTTRLFLFIEIINGRRLEIQRVLDEFEARCNDPFPNRSCWRLRLASQLALTCHVPSA